MSAIADVTPKCSEGRLCPHFGHRQPKLAALHATIAGQLMC
jgi:hypothetical protein